MNASANPSPGFARNPGKSISVTPYDGTVTIRSGDKVIASSAHAKLLTEALLFLFSYGVQRKFVY